MKRENTAIVVDRENNDRENKKLREDTGICFKTHVKKPQYIYCRPFGGFNDVMCHLYYITKYGAQHNMKVLIDATNTNSFRDTFSYYFVVKKNLPAQYRIELDTDATVQQVQRILSNADAKIEPSYMPRDVWQLPASRMRENWKCTIRDRCHYHLDNIPERWTAIDSTKTYPDADLLCSFREHGDHTGVEMLRLLRCTQVVRAAFKAKRDSLPQQYIAIHMRGTDFQARHRSRLNFDENLKNLAQTASNAAKGSCLPIVICTDDETMLRAMKKILEENQISVYFDERARQFEKKICMHGALHLQNETNLDVTRARNMRMLEDLFVLASAKSLFTMPGKFESGFSTLAKRLHENQDVLHALVYEDETEACVQQVENA